MASCTSCLPPFTPPHTCPKVGDPSSVHCRLCYLPMNPRPRTLPTQSHRCCPLSLRFPPPASPPSPQSPHPSRPLVLQRPTTAPFPHMAPSSPCTATPIPHTAPALLPCTPQTLSPACRSPQSRLPTARRHLSPSGAPTTRPAPAAPSPRRPAACQPRRHPNLLPPPSLRGPQYPAAPPRPFPPLDPGPAPRRRYLKRGESFRHSSKSTVTFILPCRGARRCLRCCCCCCWLRRGEPEARPEAGRRAGLGEGGSHGGARRRGGYCGIAAPSNSAAPPPAPNRD